jgi:membrane associated rhomboid family serine protease
VFPLKDNIPTRSFPLVTIALIAANIGAFLMQLSLGPDGFDHTVKTLGAIPREVLTLRDLPPYGPVRPPFTLLTSMFLHGGIAHIAGNMLFLWIFGNNVEDALGKTRYLFFYLAAGVAAGLTQALLEPRSSLPMVGASGAIAGVLGAYLLLYPHARVLTAVPIFIFIRLVYLPAWLFLIIWFVYQVAYSMLGAQGVAWFAHIGGFLAGFALALFIVPLRKRRPA